MCRTGMCLRMRFERGEQENTHRTGLSTCGSANTTRRMAFASKRCGTICQFVVSRLKCRSLTRKTGPRSNQIARQANPRPDYVLSFFTSCGLGGQRFQYILAHRGYFPIIQELRIQDGVRDHGRRSHVPCLDPESPVHANSNLKRHA